MQVLTVRGVEIRKGYLDVPAQQNMLNGLRAVAAVAPMVTPVTPRGKAMSVQMTAAGQYGWISDRNGYRYADQHPSGVQWPAIPVDVLNVWHAVTGLDRAPECCLINYYPEGARMGVHQDKDEADFGWPVVSISLGDDGLFRIGNVARGGKTESIWLRSGDVAILAGAARLAHHGVDRIRSGSSSLLPKGGRINLTMRVVD
ncbi:MAG: alpha-ketoglutarate-dependent dioxygenase AlkB [Sulfitobacter sp.]